MAREPRKKKEIQETQDKIQIQNKDAEKIKDPRLLQIGRKDMRNRGSATKTQYGAI
jgi:hypothetical protein